MVKFNLCQQLEVSLPGNKYPIIIGNNILSDKAILNSLVSSKQVLIVTNETIAPLYLKDIQTAFTHKQCNVIILQDGEVFKNQHSLFAIYDILIANNHHRDTTLIALGGGVIGDITGFAAATYQRGVHFVQIPTTLLAQVDASIGGKTAINHPAGKNMIGSFYQPQAVMIDLTTLSTLPQRELQAGLAEIIKYALLEGQELFAAVYDLLQLGVNFQSEKLPFIISKCCQAKVNFVQEDEREQGKRALLNLGHTVAHALESYTNYERWLHGEAVGIGLYCAALLSYYHAGLDKNQLDLIEKLLKMAHLPHKIPSDINLDRLLELMWQDKKIKNGKLHFILIKAIGTCYIDSKVSKESLLFILQNAVEGD